METVVGFTWLTEPALVVVVVLATELSDVADESWVELDSDESVESVLSLLVSLSEEGAAGASLRRAFSSSSLLSSGRRRFRDEVVSISSSCEGLGSGGKSSSSVVAVSGKEEMHSAGVTSSRAGVVRAEPRLS